MQIAKQWLNSFSFSAATWNLREHMELISRDMQVHGLPSGGIVDYAGFRKRRHNEFENKLLLSITHKGLELLESQKGSITFAVKETLKAKRGESFVLDKEICLRLEHDGKWRAVQEQIKCVTRK